MSADAHLRGWWFQRGLAPRPMGVAFRASQLLIGLVLAVAAFAKLWALWGRRADPSLDSSFSEIALINLEFLCALLLAFDIWRELTWVFGFLLFASFAASNALKVAHGYASCGCFGEVRVNPWLSLSLNLIVLAFMVSFGIRLYPKVAARRQLTYVVRALALCGIVGGLYCAVWGGVATLRTGGAKPIGRVTPAEWIGKPLPILDSIDVGTKLKSGSWRLVFFRRACDQCEAEIRRLTQEGQAGSIRRLAIIELPANEEIASTDRTDFVSNFHSGLVGRLDPRMEWIATVPLELHVTNGVVEAGDSRPTEKDQKERSTAKQQAQSTSDAALMDVACGPLSVLTVLESRGIYPSPEKKRALLEKARPSGTSLLQLKDMLESEGLHCLGSRLGVRRLHEIGLPAIISVGGTGFAAVTGYSEGAVEVVFAGKPAALVSDQELETRFGAAGAALLVSEQNIDTSALTFQPARKPAISLSRTFCPVGIVHSRHWKTSVRLQNNSDEAIDIRGVTPSCRCMTATIQPMRIELGRDAVLQVDGNSETVGPFRYGIKVETSASDDSSQLNIPVRGWFEPAAIPSRLAVSFKELVQGDRATEIVPIEAKDLAQAALAKIRVTPGAPLSAALERNSTNALQLRLDWHGTQRTGYQSYTVELMDPLDDKATQGTTIDVSCTVVPVFSSQPSSVVLTDQELQTGWQRQLDLTLFAKDNQPSLGKLSSHWNPPSLAQGTEVRVISDDLDASSRRRHIRVAIKANAEFKSLARDATRASLTLGISSGGFALEVPVWLERDSVYKRVPKND
jgi:hypothetical protein